MIRKEVARGLALPELRHAYIVAWLHGRKGGFNWGVVLVERIAEVSKVAPRQGVCTFHPLIRDLCSLRDVLCLFVFVLGSDAF